MVTSTCAEREAALASKQGHSIHNSHGANEHQDKEQQCIGLIGAAMALAVREAATVTWRTVASSCFVVPRHYLYPTLPARSCLKSTKANYCISCKKPLQQQTLRLSLLLAKTSSLHACRIQQLVFAQPSWDQYSLVSYWLQMLNISERLFMLQLDLIICNATVLT